MGRLWIQFVFLCLGQWAVAQDCFSVPVENPLLDQIEHETWCRDLTDPQVQMYWRQQSNMPVADEDVILRMKDGSWIHSSLAKGQRQVVRTTDLELVPFSIKEHVQSLEKFPRVLLKDKVLIRSQTRQLSRQLIRQAKSVRTTPITEGFFSARVTDDRMPFSGYWWPYSGQEMASGEYSPLGKFDRWHFENLNQVNESSKWEAENHNLQQVSWGGHCNGWAASSILYPEPTAPVADPISKIVFLPSDLKGILASTSFCVNWAFYGKRFRQEGDDLKDILPDRFHKLLEHYVLNLNKPIAIDYFPNAEVDNNIITGYDLTITKTGPGLFHVDARIRAANYSSSRQESPGPAQPRSFHYSYQLTTNEAGEIISGQWLSTENPDFLWVPTSQANCGRENPRVDYKKVNRILQLPKATQQNLILDREIELQLA
ncbi:MAG: hypothetical protein ACXWC9_07820, partial [Pseudobdellovibrionaceae bacterium]